MKVSYQIKKIGDKYSVLRLISDSRGLFSSRKEAEEEIGKLKKIDKRRII